MSKQTCRFRGRLLGGEMGWSTLERIDKTKIKYRVKLECMNEKDARGKYSSKGKGT